MSTRKDEIKEIELNKIEKIKESIESIKQKKSKFLFFVASTTNPAASIYEIYRHATIVKNMGFDVRILTDTSDYEIPKWIEDELVDHQHESMEKAKLSVGSHDVIVIPEIFSNVMEQTKNLPCIRIGLLQSFDYMVNGLLPANDWTSFGIKDVITTSNELVNLLKQFYGIDTFNTYVTPPTIPDYFKYNGELKKPVVTIVGRNPNEISKIVKLFYSKFPQYGWLLFDSMITDSKPPTSLRRVDYANRLKENFAAVWVDRIASFGTLPLEAMAANTITIGLVPDITPEYLLDDKGNQIENTGLWTTNIYSIPLLIGELLTKFLDDSINDEVFDTMTFISNKYSESITTTIIENTYNGILNNRKKVLEEALNSVMTPKEIIE